MKIIYQRALLLPALLVILSGCASSNVLVDYPNSDIVLQSDGSPSERNYAANLQMQEQIKAELEALSTQLSESNGGQNKTLRQITELNSQLAILERQAAAYPLEIRNPTQVGDSSLTQDQEFKDEMARKAEEKLQNMDLDQDDLQDLDPELQKAYRKYNSTGAPMGAATSGDAIDPEVFYAVQVGTGQPGRMSSYKNVGQVRQSIMSNGMAAYASGTYSSLEQARQACRDIKANTSYHDAFVVGFIQGRKVSVKEMQNYRR